MPPSVRTPDDSAYRLAHSRRCLRELDQAVLALLGDFGADTARLKALGQVRSMAEGCDACGLKRSSAILRSIESLLSLPNEETLGLKLPLAQRLLELVALLKEQASASRN